MRFLTALLAAFLLATACQSEQVARVTSRSLGVAYETVDGVTLKLDLFLPGGNGPSPAVVLLHPGGYIVGNRRQMASVAQRLAEAGFAAFSIDYRLAPDSPFPAPVQDTWAAIRFIRTHAAEYRVDAAHIALFGASAGGTIVASAALLADPKVRVQAVVSWSGILDLVTAYNSPMRAGVQKYLGSADPAEASPAAQLQPGAPPFLIVNSLADLIPASQAQSFLARCRQVGDSCVGFWPKSGHGLLYMGVAFAPTLLFLRRYL